MNKITEKQHEILGHRLQGERIGCRACLGQEMVQDW